MFMGVARIFRRGEGGAYAPARWYEDTRKIETFLFPVIGFAYIFGENIISRSFCTLYVKYINFQLLAKDTDNQNLKVTD